MIFSIIHPSRSRILLAEKTAIEWIENSSQSLEYIFSIDSDDYQLESYYSLAARLRYKFTSSVITVIEGVNSNVIQAMNSGAKHSTGDLLVCISDDFHCFKNWDLELLKVVDIKSCQLIRTNDTISHIEQRIAQLPILTRPLYDLLGYVYYPEYTGMFADNDLAEICDLLGFYIDATHLTFQHRHYTNGLSKNDLTYKRHNTNSSWQLGQSIIINRRLNKFNINELF